MSDTSAHQRMDVTVHGLVQGVFFRHHTRLKALDLGLAGSVVNRPDGTVVVIAEGPRDSLEKLLSWLAHGPELAVVERVDVTWRECPVSRVGFRILR